MNKKVYLVENSDMIPVKACSTLKKARKWAEDHNYYHEHRRLVRIIEMEINGEEWGTIYYFEEEEDE